MGKSIFCDLCRGNIPIEQNIQKIDISGETIVEACFNCAQQIKNSIRQQQANIAKQMAEAQKAAAHPAPAPQQPKEPSTPAPTQPAQPTPKPEGK